MKVLEKPDVSGWTYEFVCGNCDCHLQIEAADVGYVSENEDVEEFCARCSVCGDERRIPYEEIPHYLRFLVKREYETRGAKTVVDSLDADKLTKPGRVDNSLPGFNEEDKK
jgi:hypothetical protein